MGGVIGGRRWGKPPGTGGFIFPIQPIPNLRPIGNRNPWVNQVVLMVTRRHW